MMFRSCEVVLCFTCHLFVILMFDGCMDLGLKSGAYYQMLCMFGPFHFHFYVADFEALC